MLLVLLLLTLMLVLYWSTEMISDHIIRSGQLGKRYICIVNARPELRNDENQSYLRYNSQQYSQSSQDWYANGEER